MSEKKTPDQRQRPLPRSPLSRAPQNGRAYSRAFTQAPLMTRALQESRETPTAESFFLNKQMTLQTPIVVVLEDGERVEGILEWYDHHSMKLRGRQGTRVMIYKHAIKYLYKSEAK